MQMLPCANPVQGYSSVASLRIEPLPLASSRQEPRPSPACVVANQARGCLNQGLAQTSQNVVQPGLATLELRFF
jgi:hypothetical protein